MTAFDPLIRQCASGRWYVQCRHGICGWYLSGLSKPRADMLADTHMQLVHGEES